MPKTLNWLSNTLTRFDRKYLSEGLLYMSIMQITGMAIAAVSAYFFANFVEKGDYGTYQFVLTMFGVMSIFTLRGVGKQIVRSYVKDKETTLIPKTIQFIKFSIPVTSIGIAAGGYFYFRGNSELALSLVTISALFPLIAGLPLYNSLLLAKHQFKQQAILNSLQALIPAIAIILTILHGGGVIELVAAYAFSQALTLLGIFAYVGLIEGGFETSPEIQKSKAEYHLSLGESILDLGKIIDRLAVFSVLGATNFAIYMIALLPIRELNRLPMMVKSLILPKFSQYNFVSVKKSAIEKTVIYFFILVLLSILYTLIAPYVFTTIFSPYPESLIYTKYLVFFLPFACTAILSQALTIFDKTKELYLVNIVYSMSAILLTFTLTILFGIWGAIFAKIISSIIKSGMLLYVFIRCD